MAATVPRAPAGTGPAGRKLWRSVLADFDLGAHETLILVQACHVADTCEALQEVIGRDGPMLAGADGPRTHPACRELRQQRITLARLIVCLRVPLGDEDAGEGRSQYRGPRGAYALSGER
jgi:hypothetical protein